MSFWNSVKKGASQAQLEADKLVRVNRVKTEVNSLHEQIRQHTFQLGAQTLDLYQSEALAEPTLLEICLKIKALEEKISEKETQIAAIKLQSLPEQPSDPSISYSRQCPECNTPIPEEAVFCPACGGRTVNAGEAGAEPNIETNSGQCPSCKVSLPENADFCPNCGAQIQ
jgi:RNA polymerase subunit RPABC4/transcription elongation factor Spt4